MIGIARDPTGWRNQTIRKWLRDNPGATLKVRDEKVEGCHYLVRGEEYMWVTEDYMFTYGFGWVQEANSDHFFDDLICDGVYKVNLWYHLRAEGKMLLDALKRKIRL